MFCPTTIKSIRPVPPNQAQASPKIDRLLERDPNVTIFLRPIAAPAALGLAGFAGSTWITAKWIARWWGDESSPTIFFPFVAFWGGLGQFIAGHFGYAARGTLITVIHVLWGSFWMSIGLLYLLVATGALPPYPIHGHFPELAAWMIILTFFTWSGAIASSARDLILCAVLTTLAIGSTIACCMFTYGSGVRAGMKAAAYFWIICRFWQAFGPGTTVVKFFPIFRTRTEQKRPLLAPGYGEPRVKRGMPGLT
ncbi:hypothetical protein BJX62DRAFT_253565 [Aspergillus germanicus]